MRFRRFERHTYTDTPRKRAAVLRRQQRQRDALPLFAEIIAEEQPSVHQEMSRRIREAERSEQDTRDRLARTWRAQRARLNAIPEPDRSKVLAYWNGHKWFPGDPVQLAGFLDLYERGQLNFQIDEGGR